MNNKILARIVAAVMVVAMLGTVSFAENGIDKTNATVTAETDNSTITGLTTRTILAFANSGTTVPDEIDPDNILAVIQTSEANEYAGSFKYDASRIADGMDTVIVLFGGGEGEPEQVNIEIPADVKAPILTKINVYNTVEIGGKEYTNVVRAEYAYENTSGNVENIASYGIKMGPYANDTTNTLEDGVQEADFAFGAKTDLAAGATLKFSAILLGVPSTLNGGKTISDVGARAYITFQ